MRAVTGIKPTGSLHLGNYLGMIRPAVALAERADAYYFVADLHALTSLRDRDRLRSMTREIAAAWLALGLDPTVSVLYRQSDVPEVCELAWILSCVTAKGLLNRAHAYKAAVQDSRERGLDDDAGVNAGLFTYPVLMAADILAHRAQVVPIGADQRQHVEITRDIAAAFNTAFGLVLQLPDEVVDEATAAIPGIDGRKMSKSYGNELPVFASPAELRTRVMNIVTDSRRPEDPKDPNTDRVFALYRHIADDNDVTMLADRYRTGGIGYAEAKELLLAAFESRFGSARARYDALLAAPDELEGLLAEGARRARHSTKTTLQAVRETTGLHDSGFESD